MTGEGKGQDSHSCRSSSSAQQPGRKAAGLLRRGRWRKARQAPLPPAYSLGAGVSPPASRHGHRSCELALGRLPWVGTHNFNNGLEFHPMAGRGGTQNQRQAGLPPRRRGKMAAGELHVGQRGPPCPAACSGPGVHSWRLSPSPPGLARAAGRTVLTDPGRAAVLAPKRAQPRGGQPRGPCGEESASRLPWEQGPRACCRVGQRGCSSKKQGMKNRGKAGVEDPLDRDGPTVTPPAPREATQRSAAVPEGPPWPWPPSRHGSALPSAGDPATATAAKFHRLPERSGFSHVGKKIWSLCRNSHPKSAARCSAPCQRTTGWDEAISALPQDPIAYKGCN